MAGETVSTSNEEIFDEIVNNNFDDTEPFGADLMQDYEALDNQAEISGAKTQTFTSIRDTSVVGRLKVADFKQDDTEG